jgi:hypothetical protein
MGISAAVILGSGFLPAESRLVIWARFVVAWFGGLLVLGRGQSGISLATTATGSLVERFGMFIIDVLGEVRGSRCRGGSGGRRRKAALNRTTLPNPAELLATQAALGKPCDRRRRRLC